MWVYTGIMDIEIPIQALTINQAFQGRRFKTRKYQIFEKEMFILLPNKEMVKGWVEVSYEYGLTPSSFSISDVGNLEKCLSDVLVKKGYIEDDRKILKLVQKKVQSPRFYVKISIKKTKLCP